MSFKPRQLCRWDTARSRRDEKRAAHKRDRQESRADPENAPPRRAYRGWSY